MSESINKLTEIYSLKKYELVNICISKKLKFSGKVNKDLRPRLVRYFRGITQIADIDDSLTKEEKIIVQSKSVDDKVHIGKIKKQLRLKYSRSKSYKKSKSKKFSNNLNESQQVFESLNSSILKIDEDIKNLLDSSNIFYYNNLEVIKNEHYTHLLEFTKLSPDDNRVFLCEDVLYVDPTLFVHSR